MSGLPLAPLAAHKKPFLYSGVDYLSPLNFAERRNNKEGMGARAIYVALVTSLSLDDFLLAFTRFTDLRG